MNIESESAALDTDERIALLESWAAVSPIGPYFATLFYNRLFTVAPQVRPMFSADITSQAEKLHKTLAVAVDSAHDLDAIIPTLEQLGKIHVGYGVPDEAYDTVGECLIWTLKNVLGQDFTQKAEDAWVRLYTMVADIMKGASGK